jgi:hypothetical protein
MDKTQVFQLRVRVNVFNATSTIFQLYRSAQFYLWRKLEVPGETHRDVVSQTIFIT